MSTTTEVIQEATECWCGISFTVPRSLIAEARRQANDQSRSSSPMSVFCPLGHQFVFGVTDEVKRLRDELARTQGRLDQAQARAAGAEMQALKAARKLNRVAKGICPECKRSFTNLARHMKCKHPRES